jgi:LCP family protein required for cell wall assembly
MYRDRLPHWSSEQQHAMTEERTVNYFARVLVSAVYTLFLAGSLVFAYLFYTSVRDVVAYSPLSSGLPLPIAGDYAPRPETVPDWSQRERINILLLGVDQRPDEEGPWRSDTIIIVTVDPRSMTAGALSIPRDLYVEVPGYDEQRINMAHFLGDAYHYPGGGTGLAMKTIEYNFGIPMHYYIRVNFQGFRDIVDYLGGVTINVDKEIWDHRYPDGQYGYTTIHIPAGRQLMDGRMTLQYARTRHSGTDFDRLRRQQEVLMAIRSKALRLDLIPKIPMLASTLGYTVKTNLQLGEVITLAQIASQIDAEDIRFGVIDETMTVPIVLDNGADVLFPKRDRIRQAVEGIFYQDTDQ